MPGKFFKIGNVQDVSLNGNDEKNAFQTKFPCKTKNPRLNSKNCSLAVVCKASSKCFRKEKFTASIVSNKKKTHPRRQNQKKLYNLNQIRPIKGGQWDNYLKHAAALLLHGLQSINKEPQKRITKNSMNNSKYSINKIQNIS